MKTDVRDRRDMERERRRCKTMVLRQNVHSGRKAQKDNKC